MALRRGHPTGTASDGGISRGGPLLKILHVQETLSPRHGGPASVLPQLARAQCAAGDQVAVVTTNADHPRGVYHRAGWDTLDASAVPVYYAPVQFAPLSVSAGLAADLRRAISNFDIVHVHGLYRFPSTFAAFLARRRGIPYVISPHGSLDPYLHARSTSGKLRLKRVYERCFDLPNLHAAAAIHYTAEEEKERASYLRLRSPSFVAPIGLDWERYKALPARGALRSRWQLTDSPMVLFLGRLHFKKGLDLLIPAFDELRRRNPETQLVIAGPENDNHGQKVRRWVTERKLDSAVHFVGPLQGADVVQAYVDADVFVLPSYTENFGMTVVEALACALPVVITDQVNIHAEISSAGVGLVTQCEIAQITDAIELLLHDAARRRDMGEAGRRLVRDRFTWPAIVNTFNKEYERVIERCRDVGAL